MEDNQKLTDFNIKYHHELLNNQNSPSKQADSQRKSTAHLIQSSCKILNNENTIALLDNKLKTYTGISHEIQENIYDYKLKDFLSKSNNVIGNNFKTKLNSINAKQFMKPLHCTNVKSYCPESENFSNEEFDFLDVSKLKKDSSTIVKNVPQPHVNSYQEIKCSNTNLESKNKKRDENAFNTCFKTAREELEIQSIQKYGTGQQSNVQSSCMAQKRKLGVRGKFIPPLKSNSGSHENIKIENVDERLKNIEPKMVELIKSEIMDSASNLHWNDIVGLQFAKTAIQEAVVWPMLRPDIFTGLRKPPKGILLFGPPGTGKTLIGKCVASQSKSTFFSISASSLTSKWIGDGEKMVRALFVVARVHQPSVIFIDEVDSLLSQRSDTEHESSRRIKTEFLVQLDGATTDSEERLLVIGATNRPQELDEAARRRFVKRLYIPLPEYEARLQLVQKLISSENHQIEDEDFKRIASLSDSYSGADIKNLCSEASLGPIRSIDMNLIEHIQASDVRPLLMDDFEIALTRVKSSVSPKDLEQYISWDKTYGSGF